MDAYLRGNRWEVKEVHRFSNGMIHVPDAGPQGRWCWDVLHLWQEIKTGLRKAGTQLEGELVSIGVDSWGVDYALIGSSGRLLGMPSAYRDPRNQASQERVQQILGREAIYQATGIQFLPFNSIYQLAADALDPDAILDRCETMLMMPDLIHYWLSGCQVTEHTNASTTQLYDARTRRWVEPFCQVLHIPTRLLPSVVDAGTALGPLLPVVAEETGLSPRTKIVAPATHDTGAAVTGTPLRDPTREAYLSSGTWSLLGVERQTDCRSPAALAANFTNEAGAFGTTRFLTNRAGMWLVQECQRQWKLEGQHQSVDQWVEQARTTPSLRSFVNPDHACFAAPGDMPSRIREVCRATDQPVPETPGATLRCIFDSLALRYQGTLATIRSIIGTSVDTIRIVGGGAHNDLLNQLAADATGCQVTAGPTEAAALGNAVMQAIAAGDLQDLPQAREVIRQSVALRTYEPESSAASRERWHQAAKRFDELLAQMT